MTDKYSPRRKSAAARNRPGYMAAIAVVACVAIAACGLQNGAHLGCFSTRAHHHGRAHHHRRAHHHGRVHRAKASAWACGQTTTAVRPRREPFWVASAANLSLVVTSGTGHTCPLPYRYAVLLTKRRDGGQIGSAEVVGKGLTVRLIV